MSQLARLPPADSMTYTLSSWESAAETIRHGMKPTEQQCCWVVSALLDRALA
jgi:hypothetical protein